MMRFAVLVLCAGLAACSSVTEPLGLEDPFAVPQPFKGMERNDDMIAQAIRVPALVVAEPAGFLDGQSAVLRDHVIELARAQDIPALREATVRAWSLKGQLATIEATGKKKTFQGVVAWQLADPDGTERKRFTVAYSSKQQALGDSDLRLLARDTVNALDAALLRPGTQVAETISTVAKPTAWVGAIRGAPGDGNQALSRALAGILPLKGIVVAETQAKAEWRVEGIVKVVPGRDGQDAVTLTWRVLDPKGREAGSITQENAVPRGRLAKPWREIAGFVAEAAAEGIAQLIQQVTSGSQG
jgi:uncharacterized lipoprotein YmbA